LTPACPLILFATTVLISLLERIFVRRSVAKSRAENDAAQVIRLKFLEYLEEFAE